MTTPVIADLNNDGRLEEMVILVSYFFDEEEYRYHYENMSVQYEAISKSEKNDIFRCKNVTFFFLFLLKT